MFLKYLNLILFFSTSSLQSCWETNQADHVAKVPAPRIVRYLAECVSVKHEFEPVLRPLLTTRIPDTQVRQQQTNDLTIGWQNLNPLSHFIATLVPQGRQAKASGEILIYLLRPLRIFFLMGNSVFQK